MSEMPILEELELGTLHNGSIAKVYIIHPNLSGVDDLMDHHTVEPHSFRGHTAGLALSDKLFWEAVAL